MNISFEQPNEEISIPVITIFNDWTVDDLETEDDCDDAHALLTALVVSIESRMDAMASEGRELSQDYRRAKAALRWKKAALQVVNLKRGKFVRASKAKEHADQMADRNSNHARVLNYLRAMHPEALAEAWAHVNAGTDHLKATPK